MSIPPIPPIGSLNQAQAAQAARPAEPGFADAMARGLQETSDLEHATDAVAADIAAGGDSEIHDLMVATSKSEISMDLLLATRNRAVEAYQEIMRLPV